MKKTRGNRKDVTKPDDGQPGAVAALRRLEGEENRLFSAYEKVKGRGDELATKAALLNWLRVSESLRKFDLLVEAARRETGELLSRREVEASLRNFALWLHFSLIPATGTPAAAFDTVARAVEGFAVHGDHHAHVPVWMVRAIFSHPAWKSPDEAVLCLQRARHTMNALQLFPADYKRVAAHVAASMEADAKQLSEARL